MFISSVRALVPALVLTTSFGVAALRAETAGANVPTAVAAGVGLGREELLEQLARKTSDHFKLEGELQLELLRAWVPPARSAAVWDVQVLEFPNLPASSMMLRCRILADNTAILETNFVVRAQLWRDAWVARQPLAAGAIFDVAGLDARRVDLFRERDVVPASVGDRAYIFARAVSAGRLLTWRDITRRPLVRKGDLVEVSAVDGPLAVTMKAIAMQNGAQGETVTVRNPESRKDFSALVVEENRVQVRF